MMTEMVDSDRDLEEWLEERGLGAIGNAEVFRVSYDRNESQVSYVDEMAHSGNARRIVADIRAAWEKQHGHPADPRFDVEYVDWDFEEDILYVMVGLEHQGKRNWTGGGGIAQWLD